MNRRQFIRHSALSVAALSLPAMLRGQPPVTSSRPNVILIITDDQGYGDVHALGNPKINTPHIDKLCSESLRLTNFHVDPTCAPTRSALLSGRYSSRTGIWHTIMGRSLMAPEEMTMAEMFRANGYRTGMFGKWHLGDNAPCRPQDQGFDDAVYHKGGGVSQGPDYWGNDYFDDTYWRNGKTEKFDGYCTDIWFQEATRFIEANRGQPFFCYLSTNAPHGPYFVAEKYSQPYADDNVPDKMSKFYGMITNIDENLGKLRLKLDKLNLSHNTILIFMTDNGTAAGLARNAKSPQWRGFNAEMRGTKGSEYDGGHRVPCFIHWPDGKIMEGRNADQLCAHIDLLPTLEDLCRIKKTAGPELDGASLRNILYGDKNAMRDRILFVHSQRIAEPRKWRSTAVMTDRWRYINGKELYDINADPGQQHDIAPKHPAVVKKLTQAYEKWWQSLQPAFDRYVRIDLGSDAQNPTRLMSHDWLTDDSGQCPWNQSHIRQGTLGNGPWAVNVVQDARYRFKLYRWPRHLNREMERTHARLTIAGHDVESKISSSQTFAAFDLDLKAGPAMLQTWLTRKDGKQHGAYFVWVERL